ncbi:MAG TPA: GH25 family lysozyme [Terriglobales bacterium]|nr:GH25 family lysozyme [Terriglobales bacterium]
MVAGIDVSHYNGPVNYGKLAAGGFAFAYVKATEGRFTKDPLYPANYAGLRQNQVLRGAYHFFYPQLDAQAQASNFLTVVTQLTPGDLPPVLDVEVSGEQSPSAIAAAMQQWLDVVQQQLGRTPIIYTAAGFWNAALGGTTAFAAYPLWVAEYTGNPAPRIPTGFSSYVFWQYSQSGSVPGIAGNVDLDQFNGSSSDLNQLAGGGNNS